MEGNMTTNFTNNEMKLEVLSNLESLTTLVKHKVEVLDALDRDTGESGSFDLHDQLATFRKLTEDLEAVVCRSVSVVPGGEG
ncbi:MAG: hypothetical protein CMA31_03235 [Euryarchaeota archaeon]|jgi:hypothetical protein|nr:hypothetical protein [Euryarchaeota archaeon]|tara:strand:- start:482 stop:727 length:246 start_codon:yes stop_codon:yes gene_type:complete